MFRWVDGMTLPSWWKSDKPYIIGDCIEGMKEIPDNSVDLILTDPPYGVTQNKKDIIVPLTLWWKEINRVAKQNGAIIMTSQFPFTLDIVQSNI